jgi:hypothetical protein
MKTKQTSHSLAPWYQANTGNHQGLIISEATGANIAVVYDKKDAPLVAAAPELLEALKDMERARANGFDLPWGTLRSAITKAEGNP